MMSSSLPILYHVPNSCSEACISAFNLCGISHDISLVDYSTKILSDGRSFLDKNPLGQVSALELPDGRIITENVAILLWANENDTNGFSIEPSDVNFYALVSWLSFCSSELHRLILWPLVRPDMPSDYVAYLQPYILSRLKILETELSSKSFIIGEKLSVADSYLAWFIGFLKRLMPDILSGYDSVRAYESSVKTANARIALKSL